MFRSFLLLFLLFAGCLSLPAVGPDYQKPVQENIEDWQIEGNDHKLFTRESELTMTSSWKQFNDPVLDSLVEKTIKSNLTYQIALSRLEQARLSSDLAFSSFLPTLSLGGKFNRQERSKNSFVSKLGENPVNTYQSGFDALWEFDLFGGKRRAYQASVAEIEAAEGGASGIGISLLADLFRNYIEYRTFEKRLEIAESNIKAQTQFRDIVKSKFNAGISSEVDLLQASALLENSRSFIPQLQVEMKRRFYRLAVLSGESPTNFVIEKINQTSCQIPEINNLIAISQGAEFLRNRPDVKVAERELAAQTAKIGVAVAEIFPKITLVGGAGLETNVSSTFFDASSKTWNFGPTISLPIFQGGKISANIALQEEKAKEAWNNYQEVVLQALEEGQNSLNAYSAELKRQKSLEESFQASKRAHQLSQDLYQDGLIDFLRVLDAERDLFNAEDALIQSKAQIAVSGLAVFKAFAGKM